MPTMSSADTLNPASTATHYRPDIQGLRTVAVGAVVLYHLWPNRLPGGFIGVDVFFVISGFLITGHLTREASKKLPLNLPKFWARRIARLLPDAFLVLAATAGATFAIVPRSLWQDYFSQITASALYFQNWRLAWDSVDYLTMGSSATALQHYWSLSVEEQFYLIWPLLIVIALEVGRKIHPTIASPKSTQKVILALLSILFFLSFAYSIVATAAQPSWAFFSSFTRIWEFAAGGIAGLTVSKLPAGFKSSSLAGLLGWAGLVAILAACFFYSGATPFPGSAALLPALGAVLLLYFGDSNSPISPKRVMSLGIMVWVGAISYAIYLWHWPLIVLMPFLTHSPLTAIQKLIIGATSIGLAYLSTRFIEDPLRQGSLLARPARAFAFAGAGALVFLGIGAYAQGIITRAAENGTALQNEQLQNPCLGPAALKEKSHCDSPMGSGDFFVSPDAVAAQNKSVAFRECQQNLSGPQVESCLLGDDPDESSLDIIVAGDSHATAWLGAFDEVGKARAWSVQSLTKASCPLSDSSRILDSEETDENRRSCEAWSAEVLQEIISSEADVVVLTSYQSAYDWGPRSDGTGTDDPVAGFAEVMKEIADSGKRVVVIKAVPRTNGEYVAACVEENGRSLDKCGLSRDEALPPDLMEEAQVLLDRPDVTLLDLDDSFCDADWCYPVVGDVVVYRDYSHLSSQYAGLLMSEVIPAIENTAK